MRTRAQEIFSNLKEEQRVKAKRCSIRFEYQGHHVQLETLPVSVLRYLAKAPYHEYPVRGPDGGLVGYEWYGIRGGRMENEPLLPPEAELEHSDGPGDEIGGALCSNGCESLPHPVGPLEPW